MASTHHPCKLASSHVASGPEIFFPSVWAMLSTASADGNRLELVRGRHQSALGCRSWITRVSLAQAFRC